MNEAMAEKLSDSYDKKNFYENSIYIGNLCIQTKIMIRAKRTYPSPLPLHLKFS